MTDKPTFISRDIMTADEGYVQWMADKLQKVNGSLTNWKCLKLNFYVSAVDELLRAEGDNPTVGLIICKSSDKTVVEWSLKDINKPLGVSTYQLEQVVARTVRELEQRKGEGRK